MPYDKWVSTLSASERAKVDRVLDGIEGMTQLHPDKVKKYLELYEVRIFAKDKAFRPLAIKEADQRIIILLVGTTKKGQIRRSEYEAALSLAKLYREDDGCELKPYWED